MQAEAIAANQAALPAAQQLATGINTFNVSQRLSMLQQALGAVAPGSLERVGANINSQLRGEINPDIAQQIQRNSAFGALAGGFGGGSILGRNLTARDFGTTSMAIQQQGLQNWQGLANMITPQAFDATSMFMSPQQRLEFAFRDRSERFQRDLLYEQVKAAPDPARAALGREIDRFFNTAAQAGMAYAGGGGGMAGGMGGG